MDQITIAEGWTFKYNYVPSRKGAYFTIEHNGMEVDAEVLCWLDKNLASTAKGKKGPYLYARRFSYSAQQDGLPKHFAVKVS